MKMYLQVTDYLDESIHRPNGQDVNFRTKYNIDTTNCVESINGLLKESRKYVFLPVINESIGKIIECFNKYQQVFIGVSHM